MLSKSFVVGLLALSCVAAAAGGAYVAVKQNGAGAAAPAIPGDGPPPVQAQPVHETEALVEPQIVPETPALEAPAARQDRAVRPEPVETPRRRPAPRREEAPAPVRAVPVVEPPAAIAETLPPPEPVAYEAPRYTPPPALPVFDELVVPSSSVIGLRVETPVTSERARIEDRVEARITRDVTVDGRTALPAGSRVIGAVTLVEQGGKVAERARLAVRFHTVVLADGMELPIRTDAILREGESPRGESARKIGGAAIGGAILGAIVGGKKGAAIGGATGAAGGTAVVMTGDRNAATLPAGAVVTVRLVSPVSVSVERR